MLGVKFQYYGPISYFSCIDPEPEPGDWVLAESPQGLAIGMVVAWTDKLPADVPAESVKPILHRATGEELLVDAENRQRAQVAYNFCEKCIEKRNLDMKLVKVDILFDHSKMIFFFTAPTRIDFRELVKDLVREYHTRIELRQIGIRHETQILGAVGSCGMVCCCRRFLRKFMPVTIKMAKEQSLFLNPAKISGVCGRLLCCLSYEQENYDAFQKDCPCIGRRYQTKQGLVKVLHTNLFKNSVVMLTNKNEETEISLEDWLALDPHRQDCLTDKETTEEKPQYTDEYGDDLDTIADDDDI